MASKNRSFLIKKTAIKFAEEEMGLLPEDYEIQEFLPEGKKTKMYRLHIREGVQTTSEKIVEGLKEANPAMKEQMEGKKLQILDTTAGDVQCESCHKVFEVSDPHKPPLGSDTCIPCREEFKQKVAASLPPEQTVVKSKTTGTGVQVPGTLVKTQRKKVERTHKSTVESPTKLVWHIADEMIEKNPHVGRKTVITECVNRGIAFFTARTQYQQWLTARRESMANAEAANHKE